MACQFIKIDDLEIFESLQREKVENNMIFLGFLIVTNKLKPDSKNTITTLDRADLRMMMATGDNILTAVSVSKDCNIVKKDQEVFSLQLEKNENNEEYFIWEQINKENTKNKKDNIEDNYNSGNNLNKIMEDKGLLSIYPPRGLSDRVIPEEKEEERKSIYEIEAKAMSVTKRITSILKF